MIPNEKQVQAIEHEDGAVIVLAGPGSGKTTVITKRVAYLLNKGVIPQDILVVTFTKVTANEMEKRFNDEHGVEGVTFCTFHALFFKIIRCKNYRISDIINDDEKYNFIRDFMIKNKIEPNDDDGIKLAINEISLIKNELIEVDFYDSFNFSVDAFRQLYYAYEEYKLHNNKIDFDDMTYIAYELLSSDESIRELWQSKYKHMLIDEFQDINKAQYECMKILTEKHKNIFVVGDDDQSIYRFRGANPSFLIDFPKDFDCVPIILEVNYRSTNEIITLTNVIISKNQKRYKKNIIGTNKKGKNPILMRSPDVTEEAIKVAEKIVKLKNKGIPYNEMAVIFRVNLQATPFIDVFMQHNIPFELKDKVPSIYDHFIARDIIAYLKLALDKNDNESAKCILNKPKRYMSKAVMAEFSKSGCLIDNIINSDLQRWQIERISELSFYLEAIKKRSPYEAIKYIRKAVSYDEYVLEYSEYKRIKATGMFEVLEEIQQASKNFLTITEFLEHIEIVKEESNKKRKNTTSNNGVVLSTMHSSKGLEYDAVFVVGAIDSIIPYEKSVSLDEIEEERRLFYVGLTRAKSKLYISVPEMRHDAESKLTRFLDDIVK